MGNKRAKKKIETFTKDGEKYLMYSEDYGYYEVTKDGVLEDVGGGSTDRDPKVKFKEKLEKEKKGK